jgi:hypothetical protein
MPQKADLGWFQNERDYRPIDTKWLPAYSTVDKERLENTPPDRNRDPTCWLCS